MTDEPIQADPGEPDTNPVNPEPDQPDQPDRSDDGPAPVDAADAMVVHHDPHPAPEEAVAMSLVGHLTELRNRIAWVLLGVGVGAVVGFVGGESIIAFLAAPLPIEQPLVYTSIGDPFAIRIQIAIVTGVILSMPVILWHVWRFVAPGLTRSERRAILPWIPAALLFFSVGVAIAYAILPFAAAFLLAFQTPDLKPLLTAREYFDFVTTMFLAFGLLMEFPILLVGLSRVGIVTSDRLRRSRRVTILGIAIFAAVATPGGDLVSPTILGLTLYVLFEGTILVIRRSGR
ncbi:MAG: twin-arginine translocase subunit TatC [Chloroflexota bacterium]